MKKARSGFEKTLIQVQLLSNKSSIAVALLTVKDIHQVVVASVESLSAELIETIAMVCEEGQSISITQEILFQILLRHEVEGASRGPGNYRRFQPRISEN